MRRREALYTWQARVLVAIGFSKIIGLLFSWLFSPKEEVIPGISTIHEPNKSMAEWADDLSAINLILLIVILVVMRISTLFICQKKCPFFLMKLKAKLSGVPLTSTTKKFHLKLASKLD